MRKIVIAPGQPRPTDLNFIPRVFGRYGNGASGIDSTDRVFAVELKTAEEYRARVIQLESLIARIGLSVELPSETEDLVDYVVRTSIALTEDYDAETRTIRPWQKVVSFEELVEEERCRR